MGVNSNQYLQGINQTTGTGAPVHSAVAGDRYTDTANGTTYQYTTSWQSVSYSAGGLTYFTEAQNTTAPNATVPVDSLKAVTGTTNGDFAILPKGTGAFIVGHIPDGAYINGNKRGIYAVDIQPASLNYASGATGTYAVAIGAENSATANGSVAIGYGASASGALSVAIQNASNATGYGSVAIGTNTATASGTNSVALGGGTASSNFSFCVNSTAAGLYAIGLGGGNASTNYATAIGDATKATGAYSMSILAFSDTFSHRSRLSYGAKNIGATNPIGSVQGSTLVTSAETTTATPTTMTTNGALAIPLILQNNNSIRFKGTIIGRQSGSTNTSAWDFDGLIQRGTTAATTTLLISNVNLIQNTPAWGTPTLTADTTNGGLDIKVIGAATTNIRWTCVFTTTEVIYA